MAKFWLSLSPRQDCCNASLFELPRDTTRKNSKRRAVISWSKFLERRLPKFEASFCRPCSLNEHYLIGCSRCCVPGARLLTKRRSPTAFTSRERQTSSVSLNLLTSSACEAYSRCL